MLWYKHSFQDFCRCVYINLASFVCCHHTLIAPRHASPCLLHYCASLSFRPALSTLRVLSLIRWYIILLYHDEITEISLALLLRGTFCDLLFFHLWKGSLKLRGNVRVTDLATSTVNDCWELTYSTSC